MKVNLHTPIEEVQIPIIPLIDVIFCILTFFLLASLQFTHQQAISVDLPKASTSTATASQNSNQIVTIDAIGNTYIEKELVQRDELAQRLRQYLQANPDGILILNASKTATYNDVIQTLDLLRQVGGDRVSLGIIPSPSQPNTNSPNPLISPNFPINPGEIPAPIPGVNPEGNLNPSFPTTPNQPPTGQGISPVNPGISPVVPNAPVNTPVPQR